MVHCSVIGLVVSTFVASFSFTASQSHDPCCSFPCKNQGICLSKDVNIYECDCTGTGYYGINCETHRITRVSVPSPYRGLDSYPTWQGYANNSMYTRSLPPVPQNCPTPMGVKGKTSLPDAQLLVNKFFTRHNFEPCPRRTSVTFIYFSQHFSHQFFKTDFEKGMPSQWGDHAIDLSHVYGDTLERQHALRSHVDGKLKYSIINNEVFPPLMNETTLFKPEVQKPNAPLKFAIGHKYASKFSTFLVFATIWLREHNRVCDVLKYENPAWDDERLFQTARLILTGETMKIASEDYVQQIGGHHFHLLYDPTLLHDEPIGYSSQINSELNLIYHWHALIPDYIQIGGQAHPLSEVQFDPNPMLEAGLTEVITSASRQFAGKILAGQPQVTLEVAKTAILDGRKLRLQSLNNYRKRFGLLPYKSFEDFAGDKVMAQELKEMYGDIDALEFFVGVMLEKRQYKRQLGQTLVEMVASYAIRVLLSNPIGSPAWWKPSTFGGQKGFDIIHETNLQKLICRNLEGCPSVSLRVPDGVDYVPVDSAKIKDDSSKQASPYDKTEL